MDFDEEILKDKDTSDDGVSGDDLGEKHDDLLAKHQKLNDDYLRCVADRQNDARIHKRSCEDAYNHAVLSIIVKLLPVVDNIERASYILDSTSSSSVSEDGGEKLSATIEGILLVSKELVSLLDKYGVTPFSSVGSTADPSMHNITCYVDSEEVKPGVVTETLQKGYKMGDRVIRPEMVIVSKSVNE